MVENANGHKQLIESVKDELLFDLLSHHVNYSILHIQYKYSKVQRLSSFKSDMFISADHLMLLETNMNGTCGYDAFGKALGTAFQLY
jgi:hypothetical protein